MKGRLWSWAVGLGLVSLAVTAQTAEAQCIPGYSLVPYAATFSCYRLTVATAPLNWTTAEAAAVGLGGHLASIGSADENTAARNFVNSQIGAQSVWIGFNDQAVEGTFVWANGEPVVFTNWNGGEPNNQFGVEDFTEFLGNGAWNDLPSSSTRIGLIESAPLTAAPEPATVALMATGLVGVVGVARRRRR